MTTTAAPAAAPEAPARGAPRPADVFVVFGITGDLAKVMTFHSLYRLEKRGLLDAPPPVHAYAPGTWGPAEADKLVAEHGRWHGPWVVPS